MLVCAIGRDTGRLKCKGRRGRGGEVKVPDRVFRVIEATKTKAFALQLTGALAAALLLVVLIPARAGAQGLTGEITGIVQDPSQAVIPGAEVILTQESTGAVRRTSTNAAGYFSIIGIPAGTYTLKIQSEGFSAWEKPGIVLHPGDKLAFSPVVLEVATTGQEVTVVAEAAGVIPVDTGEKYELITSKEIDNLSVLGRSADELLKILPGVVYTNPDDPGTPAGFVVQFNRGIGDYNVAGTRNTQVANISDGANVIDPGCNCGSAVTPNMDMVQEVKVQTANFAAENALGPVVFNAVSKSGTSEFHGEAYLYARHSIFNAQDWRANFFGEQKPNDSFYFPGFNIGGPLSKSRKKLFFFTGIEFQRQNHDLGVKPAIVPTEAMRRGDFSDADYLASLAGYDVNTVPGNDDEGNNNWEGNPLTPDMLQGGKINPDYIDPGGQVMMNLLPLPNKDPKEAGGYNYTSHIVNPEHRRQFLTRVDYNISDATKLYTRFNYENQQSPYPYTLWWYNSNDVPWPGRLKGNYNTYSSSTSLVKVLDPSTTNEVVFAVTYWSMPHKVRDPEKVSRSALGYPYKGIFKGNGTDLVPSFTDWGGGVADFIQPGGLDDPGIFGNKWLVSIADNFSKVIGTHTTKFGAYFALVTNEEVPTYYDQGLFTATNWGGNSTGNAYADLLLGRISDFEQSSPNFVTEGARKEISFYAQDSWKVTPRFTLEYGMRFAHKGWTYERNGYMFGFDSRLYDPNAPEGAFPGLVSPHLGWNGPKSILKTPALTFSPRFGFAFDLTGGGTTVIRGGFGVYRHVGETDVAISGTTNPPLLTDIYKCCGLELWELEQIDPEKEVLKPTLFVMEPLSSKIPTTYSWSFTLSKSLPGRVTLEASYVGNSSSHQRVCDNCAISNINAVPEGAMFGFPLGEDPDAYRPYQRYGAINMVRYALSQNYNSLQVTATKQAGRLNFSAAYTFSKALGVGGATYGTNSDAFDARGRSYGPLPYDRTHSFSIAYNYLLPGKFNNPVAKALFEGWQISGISQLQSGGPLAIPTDNTYSFSFSGTMANGEDISAIRVNGTPDTPARPILVCDPREGLDEGQYANPACFVAPLPGHNGTYAMPYMKRPAFQNHDLSLFKNWQFNEHRKLQFRFSMYNFVNHPLPYFEGGDPGLQMNFVNGLPDEDTMKNFGRTHFKRGRRLMQLAIKYYF